MTDRHRMTVTIRDGVREDAQFHIFEDQIDGFRRQGDREGFEIISITQFTPSAAVLSMFSAVQRPTITK